ncbi:class I SAM-dependent methyltransferase [Desulfosporosinus youngiae]|uniref:SAM-dependent methyltransferase, tRNA(Uracil-5)-methyltransferase n=1 Tax=Desulfosporosinus youngiae DSM 17734 TaxID=768710 RepID=H5Y451_9FIRM|nr:class I SAM-dependent methyltransferase [Desulfosporosinus youngiae]EHQ89732.1 SAM-dependent methyltransferase, tRNA(uracil-5)-methyltransferase [Desulfosporosinus youngiae DSM 17734]
MTADYYEQLLNKFKRNSEEAEAHWDARAEQFNSRQQMDTGYTDQMISFLLKKGLVSGGSSVLDIGCGSGRYSIPLARTVQKVTALDISTKMLDYLKFNAENTGLKNIEGLKLDWADLDLKEMDFQNRFDLVFAAMCPGIKSQKSLEKMSQASRNYCLIAQFIETKDGLAELIKGVLGSSNNSHDPHNDRNSVYAIFNLLWLQGLEPEITYLLEKGELDFTVEEALQHYERWLQNASASQKFAVKDMILDIAEEGMVKVTHHSTLALILWKAAKGSCR